MALVRVSSLTQHSGRVRGLVWAVVHFRSVWVLGFCAGNVKRLICFGTRCAETVGLRIRIWYLVFFVYLCIHSH